MDGYLLGGSAVNRVKDTCNLVRRNGIGNSNNRHRNTATGNGNSDSAPIPAQITAGNATDGFTLTLYANGPDQPYTGTATNCRALDMACSDSACIGEWVYVFPSTITVTGGSEK